MDEGADYIRWLEERSMLFQSDQQDEAISGKGVQWREDFGRPEPPLVLSHTLGDAMEASFDEVFGQHQEYDVPPCSLHLLDTSDDAAFRTAWLDFEAMVRSIADVERILSILQVPGRIH